MRRIISAFIFIFILYPLFAQNKEVVTTDTSTITTCFYKELNQIRVFNKINNKDKTYFTVYNSDTKELKESALFLENEYAGIRKFYEKGEVLVKEINYEECGKFLYPTKKEPFDDLLLLMKRKADSIIIGNFSNDFFQTNIKWNCAESHYYGKHTSKRWFDTPKEKPISFLFRYYIYFDDIRKYSAIEFVLDSMARLVHQEGQEVKGLRNCNGSFCNISINYEQAIKIAQESGLKLESDFYFYLDWFKEENYSRDYLGEYELIIAEIENRDKTENKIKETYSAVLINPWTGELKKTTKMERIVYIHENSSSFSKLRKIDR